MARRGAALLATWTRDAAAGRGRVAVALSGGRTPLAMLDHLRHEEVPWEAVDVWQVDERVAPDGDPARNLTHLRESLGDAPAEVRAMPVGAANLHDAAASYAALLPDRFDLIHLGLGPDGHTASLVPGDPVLDVTDRLVAVTAPYQDHRRMTLTYPALARADQLLWLVTGADKRGPLAQVLAGDPSVPGGRVVAPRSLVLCDTAAGGEAS